MSANQHTNNFVPSRSSELGFTLIEAMIVIAIIAIVLSLAVPSMSKQLADRRVKLTAQTIASALKEAKSDSIIRRKNSTVELDATNNVVTIKIDSTEVAKYPLNGSSTVTISPTTATKAEFTPQKRALLALTYTVCDSGIATETPIQVTVDVITNVRIVKGGTCS